MSTPFPVPRLPDDVDPDMLVDGDVPAWDTTARRFVPQPQTGGGGGGGAVDSVNGKTGAVVLGAGDVGAAPASHNHAASDITSGTLDVARIPTGTTGSTVALGNHTHTPGDIGAATAAQGALADTAVQPGDLADVATSGAYADLSGRPTIPSAPGDVGAAPASHTHTASDVDSTGASSGEVLTADGSGGATWAEATGGGGGAFRFAPVPTLGPTTRVAGGGAPRAWVPLNPHSATAIPSCRIGNSAGDLSGLPLSITQPLVYASHTITVATEEAGASLRWGLYGVDADGMPVGLPVLDSGSISLESSGLIVTSQSGTVPPGDYWLLAAWSSPGGTARVAGWTTPWQMSIQGDSPTGEGHAFSFGTASPASALPDVSTRSSLRTNFTGRGSLAVLIGGAP